MPFTMLLKWSAIYNRGGVCVFFYSILPHRHIHWHCSCALNDKFDFLSHTVFLFLFRLSKLELLKLMILQCLKISETAEITIFYYREEERKNSIRLSMEIVVAKEGGGEAFKLLSLRLP